jgi:hypothetical protein
MFICQLSGEKYIESVSLVKKENEKIQLGSFGLRKDSKKV